MPNQRLITYNGKTQSVSAWGRELGIPHMRIFDRMRIGWSFERAISEPLKENRMHNDSDVPKICSEEGCDKPISRRGLCRNHYQAQFASSKSAAYKRWYAQMPSGMRLYYGAKKRAKEQGIEFKITPEDIFIPDVCPVLGMPLERSVGKASPNSPSLDRIIPELGYVPGNVRVISMRANAIKNDANLDELLKVAAYLERALLRKAEVPQ